MNKRLMLIGISVVLPLLILAAIQALYAQNQAQAERIQALEADNAALKTENAAQQQALDDLQKRMAALEAAQGSGR
jgi:hypothetical protein